MNTGPKTLKLLLIISFAIGLVARLQFSTWPPNFDTNNYRIDAEVVLSGGNIYREQVNYNYTPVWAWVTGIIRRLGGDFNFNIHLLLIMADTLVAICVSRIAAQYFQCGNEAFLFYWLNPAVIWLVGYWGSFDILATLPLIAVVASSEERKGWQIWALGTLALLIKHNTLFSVWALYVYFFRPRLAFLVMVLTLMVFAASFVPYLDAHDLIVRNVLLYSGTQFDYGFSLVLPRYIAIPLFFVVMIGLPLSLRYSLAFDLPHMMIAAVLALFVFQYGASASTSLLIIIWASVKPNRWLVFGTLGVLGVILSITVKPSVVSIPLNLAWVIYLLYLGNLLREHPRRAWVWRLR